MTVEKEEKHFFFIWLLVQTPTFLGSEWVRDTYYTFWVRKWPHNRGKISYHMWYWPFRFFLAEPIFQLRYWAVSPLQRPKNDDPTRVKAENKCESTGWTVKSRPHQIVECQTFLILIFEKMVLQQLFDSGLFHLSKRYFWLWSIHLHLFSIKCVIVFVTAKVICKCWSEFSKNSSAISLYHFNWLSKKWRNSLSFLDEFWKNSKWHLPNDLGYITYNKTERAWLRDGPPQTQLQPNVNKT